MIRGGRAAWDDDLDILRRRSATRCLAGCVTAPALEVVGGQSVRPLGGLVWVIAR